jgi:hypothetical protein
MAYSTFQSITGPSGPEGIKAVGVAGPSGNTGPTGATGPEAPNLTEYKWSVLDTEGNTKARLTFSDESVIYIDGLTGPSGYGTGTADASNLTNFRRLFKARTTTGPGVTFQFRGLTATDDLSLVVGSDEISISGTSGVSSAYVESGSTGEFLHLYTQWKSQGASGSFYGASADNTGTGDSITVKFRNAIGTMGNEYNLDYCDRTYLSDGDEFQEYILDVSNIVSNRVNNSTEVFGYLCITSSFLTSKDRIVVLRTKVDSETYTDILKLPLYGASEVNFADPSSGKILFAGVSSDDSSSGYGNNVYRRGISDFNTPYENTEEDYVAGIHPQLWNSSGIDYDCPTPDAVIFDTNCSSDEDLSTNIFRGQSFCEVVFDTDNPNPLNPNSPTSSAYSYCIRLDDTMFESQNENDPWYGKIRLVVMPGCSNLGTSSKLGFQIGCGNPCASNGTDCCFVRSDETNESNPDGLTGRFELDITNHDNILLNAPVEITGITWGYEQRAGLSLDSDDGINYAETKNVTLLINGGPYNIVFPSNVKFAGTPTFTNGVDIVNLLTVDNGKTWFATLTGYGWDVNIFSSDNLGSCCSNLGCIDYVSQSYCDTINGAFEEGISCYLRTEDVCGAGITGACCTGTYDEGTIIYCPPQTQSELCAGELGEPSQPNAYSSYVCTLGECGLCCTGETSSYGFCENDELCGQTITKCCVPLEDGNGCFSFPNNCIRCDNLDFGFGTGSYVGQGDGGPQNCAECRGDIELGPCCAPCPVGCIEQTTQAECASYGEDATWRGIGGSCTDCLLQYDETITTLGTPACLPDRTLLQCDLINGVFIPTTADRPNPCEARNETWQNGCEYNACVPPVLGSCCDKVTGTCYGIMRESQCEAYAGQNHRWISDGECDDCCLDPQIFGACCLCDENCLENITPQECSAYGGVFMGVDSLCASVNCSIAGPCNCRCAGTGCCNCPEKASPCCTDSSLPECCSPGDDCCPDNDKCCDGGQPDCDGECDCERDPNSEQCLENGGCDNRDIEDPGRWTGFPGGDQEPGSRKSPPGPGGKRGGDKGACCDHLGCRHLFAWDIPGGSDGAARNARKCFGSYHSGSLCSVQKCELSKHIGACCCIMFKVQCPDLPDGQATGPNRTNCIGCKISTLLTTCTNCSFNGEFPGINQPINGRAGPSRPLSGGYSRNSIYEPGATDPKGRDTGKPYYPGRSGSGPLPFGWRDCCKSPGGCTTKPCTLTDKYVFDRDFPSIFENGGDADCSGLNFGECNSSMGDQFDPCMNPPDCGQVKDLMNACGKCPSMIDLDGDGILDCHRSLFDSGGLNYCCSGPRNGTHPGQPREKEQLLLQSNVSSCKECKCGPDPVLMVMIDCPGCSKCENRIFSQCKFVYDMNNNINIGTHDALTGSSCGGIAGDQKDGRGALGSMSVCDSMKKELWGEGIQDNGPGYNSNPPWSTEPGFIFDSPFETAGFARSNISKSSPDFRTINTMTPTVTVRNSLRIFGYKRR